MTEIHPSALVDPRAELEPGVTVGPYAVISGLARIGSGTAVGPHSFIEGPCAIGKDNRIGAFVHLGGAPPHLQYRGEETRLSIGDANQFREFVTVHRGTAQGRGETVIGSHNFIMVGCHLAHDCVLGDFITMANYVQLAGHCRVFDRAVFGGLCAAHQHVRVGRGVMVGGMSGLEMDAPPFSLVAGPRARFVGLNRIGLKRMGMNDDQLQAIKQAYRIIQGSGLLLKEALSRAETELGRVAEVAELIEFFRTSERGVIRR